MLERRYCSFIAIAGLASGAENQPIPDFSSLTDGWVAINSDFTPVPGIGPKPVTFDPKYPFRRNDEPGPATYRVADLNNPNLKPWAIAELKKYNDLVFAGNLARRRAGAACRAAFRDFRCSWSNPSMSCNRRRKCC